MPIRPENRGRYPDDWPEISRRIRLDRAGGRCECTGECGRHRNGRGLAITYDGPDTAPARCMNWQGGAAWGSGSPVVLTVAHLDHTPENCDVDNLRAMCQGCHLHYDREHHAETRQATRRAALAATMDPPWKD